MVVLSPCIANRSNGDLIKCTSSWVPDGLEIYNDTMIIVLPDELSEGQISHI